MVGYTNNHKRDTNKFYNPDTKRVITTRYVRWDDWKMTHPAETLKMFRKAHKEDLVIGIEEDIIPVSETEDNMPVHVISDEGEIVRLDEMLRSHQSLLTKRKTKTQTCICTIEY